MLSLRKIAQIVAEIEEINNGFVDFDKYQEIIKKYKVLKIEQENNVIKFSCINNESNLPKNIDINIYKSNINSSLSNGFKALYENRPVGKLKQELQKLIIAEEKRKEENLNN